MQQRRGNASHKTRVYRSVTAVHCRYSTVLIDMMVAGGNMRDKRFIAEHRGGPLNKGQHQLLMQWACDCAEHVLHLYGEVIDARLIHALDVAKKWQQGNASVGDARNAAVGAHAVAREATNPTAAAVARAVGHAVATAHMADHALGPALYALRAVQNAGKSIDAEMKWQNERLPPEITELVLSALQGERYRKMLPPLDGK
jgi:hypothetical protein